jgi:hypothetical protein
VNTVTLAVTAGDLIVVFSTTNSGQNTYSVVYTDTALNTYASDIQVVSDRQSVQSISYAIATSTTTLTITATSSNRIVEWLHAANFSNNSGTIPGTLDVSNSASGSGASTVNITTTVTDDLIVGFGDASSALNAGTGFTVIGQTVSSVRVTSEYQTSLTNSIGTNTVTLSGGSPFRSILAVALKPPTGGATPKLFRRTDLNGLGAGGPFFHDPLATIGASIYGTRRLDDIYGSKVSGRWAAEADLGLYRAEAPSDR